MSASKFVGGSVCHCLHTSVVLCVTNAAPLIVIETTELILSLAIP